ncbi:MAG: hypothetical protein COA84_07570 [Robiginitomaculum sp.]|nr:MAG: hypothetical protein COA84_07570 [Robiginitomaculum sp.]
MALQSLYGDKILALVNNIPQKDVVSSNYRGRARIISDRVSMATAANVASTIAFAKIPSSANLLRLSKLFFGAAGAGVTLDIGFKDDASISLSGKTAALASAVDVSSAGNTDLIVAPTIDKIGSALWEVLGLTEDPRKDLTLILTTGGAATAGGATIFALEAFFVVD